jgi:hypothetical protein
MPSEPNRVSQRPFVTVASDEEGCGLIAYGQFTTAVNYLEIRRVPRSPSFERAAVRRQSSAKGAIRVP